MKVSIYRPAGNLIILILIKYTWAGDQIVLRAGRHCHKDTVSMDTPHLQSIVEL